MKFDHIISHQEERYIAPKYVPSSSFLVNFTIRQKKINELTIQIIKN